MRELAERITEEYGFVAGAEGPRVRVWLGRYWGNRELTARSYEEFEAKFQQVHIDDVVKHTKGAN